MLILTPVDVSLTPVGVSLIPLGVKFNTGGCYTVLNLTPSGIKLTPTGVKINTNLVWTSHNTGGVEFNTGVFAVILLMLTLEI